MTVGVYRSRNPTLSSTEKNQVSIPSISNGIDSNEKKEIIDEHSQHEEDGIFQNGIFIRHRGLNWFVTGLFVVGELAGGGLVAIPTAMVQLGIYVGLPLALVMNVIFMITGFMLGVAWNVLLRRWPQYRSHCRKPYPEIAYRALGPVCRLIVTICIDVTQFGIAVVYLLLSAKNIHDALKSFVDTNFSFCYVILILAACLTPVLFLKSPQDFWWAVVFAMFTTSAAVILILTGALMDNSECHKEINFPKFKLTNIFLGMGTLLFAYGGHSAFPTIQHDMKMPHQFTRSSTLAFIILFIMYTPVGIIGYYTYGDSLHDSVINSIQTQGIQQAINLLITVHCILTLTIVFSPLNQDMEEIFKVPQKFGPRRVIVRTGMMVAVVFAAESVPTFGPLLDLMGGSTLTLTSVVFPALFYIFLTAGEKKAEHMAQIRGYSTEEDEEPPTFKEMLKYSDKKVVLLVALIIVFGVCGGAAATYSAIKELSTTEFSYPCYVLPFLDRNDTSSESTYCCGIGQNITVHTKKDFTCPAFKDIYV